MPRGYLKGYARSVGTKAARGGNSRRPEWHRTPVFLLDEGAQEDRWRRAWHVDYLYLQGCNEDYDLDALFDDGYEDDTAPVEHVTSNSNAWFKSSVASDPAVMSSEDGERIADSSEKLHFNHTDVHGISSESDGNSLWSDGSSMCQGTTSTFVQGFSFCHNSPSVTENEFSACSENSASTSFCMVAEDTKDDMTVGSDASSVWEFVVNMLEKGPAVPSILPSETDLTSIISQLPEPKQTVERLSLSEPCTFRQCAICLQCKPNVIRLMQKCCHPAACMECLQSHYLDHQMKDVSNFPLRCFWPGCDRTLRDVQIGQLTRGRCRQKVMTMYYEQESQARAIRRHVNLQVYLVKNFKCLQGCPACARTQLVRPAKSEWYECCGEMRLIDVISLSQVQELVHATGPLLVNCPSCLSLIVKDGGCDQMMCICGHSFSFKKAQQQLRQYSKTESIKSNLFHQNDGKCRADSIPGASVSAGH